MTTIRVDMFADTTGKVSAGGVLTVDGVNRHPCRLDFETATHHAHKPDQIDEKCNSSSGFAKNQSVLGQMERWPPVAGHGGSGAVRWLPARLAPAHVVPVSLCAAGRTRVARSAMQLWRREKRVLLCRRAKQSGRSERR